MNQLNPLSKITFRRWQFGLRSLLLVITVAAMGSAWYGWRVRNYEQLCQYVEDFNAAIGSHEYWKARELAVLANEFAPSEMVTEFMVEKADAAIRISEPSPTARERSGFAFQCQLDPPLFVSALGPVLPLPDPRLAAITVPVGFTVEIAAESPLIEHPIMAGFDDRGRLFVAENAGKNLRREDLEKELPNSIVLLTDTNGDGVFDKRSVFADKLTFPQGAMWHDGWLYVASSGAIWRFKDKDGDDVADVREQIVSKFGYTGNAADVHGCFLGPEGRIYWCEGRHGHEITNAAGEVISKGKAARIFSCLPDGSDVQTHCGGGMDNPTEIDWTSTGEMLGTVNIFYPKRGDCLVHWLHGGVYPRQDQPAVLAEFKRTGELLGEVHDFGHVAVSGLCRYRPFGSKRTHGFGPSFNDLWFVTEFNTHKLKQVTLEREGSTFRPALVKDFLTSTSNDFHPTDVLQDADGSLLVVDTGGWFRIGCPTSQFAKPEVPGAIYRVRRKVEEKIADPWGNKIVWNRATAEELIALLADDRHNVRARAVTQLVRNKDAAVPYLAKAILDEDATRRLQAIESLTKIGSAKAASVLLDAAEHEDARVRQLAAFALGSLRETQAVDVLTGLLTDDQPAEVQLAAATALGKIGEPAAVSALLEAIAGNPDRSREHALIYALIEIGDPAGTRPALNHAGPLVRRAGLIALDQMSSGDLKREEVAALLATGDLALQTSALDVLSRRAGWTAELVASVGNLLDQPQLDEAQQTLVVSALVAFAKQTAVQQLLADRLSDEKTPAEIQRVLLEALGQARLDPLPAMLRSPLLTALKSNDTATALAAISAIAATPREFEAELRTLAADAKRPADLRLAALAIVSAGQALSANEFAWLETQLAANVPPALRIVAARSLGSANLSNEQQTVLTKHLAAAGPLEIIPLLGAFERSGDEPLGKQLAAALLASPGSAALSLSQLETLVKLYPDSTREAMKPIIERLQAATLEQRTRLEQLTSTLPSGNATSGKQVYFNRQAGCFLCHRVGTEGGRVGPDLSTIGQRRNQRDLLEAVIFPSSSLSRGYESHALLLEDGRTLTGLITRETADALVLRAADQSEIRVSRSSVEEMKPSNLSIMPAGLEKTMSPQQLADLIAYLQALK